ncbi:hypothetical protein BAE30_08545 [Acidithiobacillus caldus]|jgi:hypothetical protein|uniref:Uncharacterized protein n=1 Tax=Acidithiobacillus caldus TaxID=33059 RepID=A0A1E7YVC3_9PROT|nr:hypothetical protein BAE30_08545 [Acidithiobacillus caldus]
MMRYSVLGIVLAATGWVPVIGMAAVWGTARLLGLEWTQYRSAFRFALAMTILDAILVAMAAAAFYSGLVPPPGAAIIVIPAFALYGGVSVMVRGERFQV